MAWNISERPLAELVALFPFTLTRLEKLIDVQLKKFKEEKYLIKSEFTDKAVHNFEIDMSISFFRQIKEFLHQTYFKDLVDQARK